MKTIEQAAKDYAERNTLNTGADRTKRENSFKAGSEFAQQWISVEDELPMKGECVLAKDQGNYFFVAELSVHGWIDTQRNEYCDHYRKITHWRPIELK